MAAQPVCLFYKFGHCKFQKKCRKMHIEEKCENVECNVKECILRHPKVCSFLRDYKFCKFSEYCSFSHSIQNNSNDAFEKEIDEIKKQIDILKESENNLEKQISKLMDEISEKESIIRNIFSKLNENDILEKKVHNSEERNKNLESRLETLEETIENLTLHLFCDKFELVFRNENQPTEHTTESHVNKRSVTEEEHVSTSTVEMSSKTDENLTEDQDKVFQCENCNIKSSSEHGIQIHTTKKHSQFCHFCKLNFPNTADMKNHTFNCGKQFYNSPMMSPVQNRGQFSQRFPQRFPPRFPMNPYDV